MIVIGGAAESLDAKANTYRLTLQNRQGFVRVALNNGAELVPVLGFGENDVFDIVDNPRGSKLRNWQDWLQKKMGFALPLFRGRGIFNYNFGLLPYRKPITVVVGEPIPLEPLPDHLKGKALITTEEGRALVDKYHQIYMQQLTDLFHKHKTNTARLSAYESICFVDDEQKNKALNPETKKNS